MFKFAETLKNMFLVKSKLDELQKALKNRKIEVEVGGGLVKVVMDAQQNVLDIEIDDSLLSDKKMLHDLLLSALSEGKRRAQEAATEEMQKILGDIGGNLGDVGSLIPS